jgi:hypothetical protein
VFREVSRRALSYAYVYGHAYAYAFVNSVGRM